MRSSRSALGAYYKRMCTRIYKPKAMTAIAHKFARLICAMVDHRQGVSRRPGDDYFGARYRQRVLRNLNQRAKTMSKQLVPSDNLAEKHQ